MAGDERGERADRLSRQRDLDVAELKRDRPAVAGLRVGGGLPLAVDVRVRCVSQSCRGRQRSQLDGRRGIFELPAAQPTRRVLPPSPTASSGLSGVSASIALGRRVRPSAAPECRIFAGCDDMAGWRRCATVCRSRRMVLASSCAAVVLGLGARRGHRRLGADPDVSAAAGQAVASHLASSVSFQWRPRQCSSRWRGSRSRSGSRSSGRSSSSSLCGSSW
jgi:hypothetical protein